MTSRKFTMQRSWERQATIGFLGATTPTIWGPFIATFEQRLRELGWVNGGNIAIDDRWAEGRHKRYAQIAKEFVRDGVDIIVTSGTAPAIAAEKATLAGRKKSAPPIPVVTAASANPIKSNLVGGFAPAGGSVTGMSNGRIDLPTKRLRALRRVIPHLKRLAILGNPAAPNAKAEMKLLARKANRLRIKTVPCLVQQSTNITRSIKQLEGKVDAIYVCTDAFLTTHQVAIHTAAASAKLPTMHAFREYVEAGGLMSYGPNFHEIFRHAAGLVDRILRGAEPGTLPVKVQPASELVINHSTAKALGVKIPRRIRHMAIR
jgi:putative ABC transport system substrate-binding protein